jgi:hypothetical protein
MIYVEASEVTLRTTETTFIWQLSLIKSQVVQVIGVTFQNANTTLDGGAIKVLNGAGATSNITLSLLNVMFVNNTANTGAGIWMQDLGHLSLNIVTFVENSITLSDKNSCDDGGAAVRAINITQIDIDFCNFTRNVAKSSCG